MQHRASWILGLSLFAIGCGDNGSSSDGSGGGSGSEDGESTTNATMPGTTASASEAMTSAATGDTGTTASVDGTSSGTSEGSSSGSSSTGPAESSSSGMPPDPDYPPCDFEIEPVCPEPYDHCFSFVTDDFTVCSVTCSDDDECPPPQSGTATAICDGPDGNECVLDCSDDATCPDGMECVELGIMMLPRCLWPTV